jgi:hypothetical protein
MFWPKEDLIDPHKSMFSKLEVKREEVDWWSWIDQKRTVNVIKSKMVTKCYN